MIFLVDIHFILLIIIFLTHMNILTNQQFINIVHHKRSLIFPFNSTLRKHFNLKNHLINLTFSRKRRQSHNEFKSDSLKYFTCTIVNKLF